MADEYSRPPYNRNVGVPAEYAWPKLWALNGAALEGHYIETLRTLGNKPGLLGQIFTKSQNKIQDPAKLARLVGMIDEDDWVMLPAPRLLSRARASKRSASVPCLTASSAPRDVPASLLALSSSKV